MNKNKTINEYSVSSFMSNVNKLDMYVHTRTHNPVFGTVQLLKPAGFCGKRKFSVKKSEVIPNGTYTFKGLRTKLLTAVTEK